MKFLFSAGALLCSTFVLLRAQEPSKAGHPLKDVRGGAYAGTVENLKITSRPARNPNNLGPTVGFRCVLPH